MRTLSLLTLLLASAVVNLGCEGDDIAAPPSDDQPTLTVLPSVTNLGNGKSIRLTARVRQPDGSIATPADVTWESANSAIATVDATGLVYGLKPGRAQIIAKWQHNRSSSLVTVLAVVSKKPTPPPTPQCLERGTRALSESPNRGKCL